ncbi:hypothetical protein [Allokutzneria oryzae]|uniref:Thiamine biosynthesis protein ThiF n=1 Tax=Allokutzneria oryzae TaxID=1378989 RepID=A0ABV6A2P2_9PSEU
MNATGTHPAPLPKRPRLLPGLPVLWRGEGTVQIGLDPRYAVVVDRLSPDLVRVLRELDGRHTLQHLLATGAPDGGTTARSDLAGLLTALSRAGVLDRDGAPSPASGSGGSEREPPPGLAVDAGVWALRTGRACSDVLAERGRAAVTVHGTGRVTDALASLLRSAGIGSVRKVAKRSRSTPDFVVLTGAAVRDQDLRSDLMSRGVSHLAVELHEASAHVGPLVSPGRSSCLTCADHWRGDRDPGWAVVAGQLGGLSPPEELVCAHGAAVFAAGQVLLALGHLRGGAEAPPTWNAAIELDPVRAQAFRRSCPPHHRCGCGGSEGGSVYM